MVSAVTTCIHPLFVKLRPSVSYLVKTSCLLVLLTPIVHMKALVILLFFVF